MQADRKNVDSIHPGSFCNSLAWERVHRREQACQTRAACSQQLVRRYRLITPWACKMGVILSLVRMHCCHKQCRVSISYTISSLNATSGFFSLECVPARRRQQAHRAGYLLPSSHHSPAFFSESWCVQVTSLPSVCSEKLHRRQREVTLSIHSFIHSAVSELSSNICSSSLISIPSCGEATRKGRSRYVQGA